MFFGCPDLETTNSKKLLVFKSESSFDKEEMSQNGKKSRPFDGADSDAK